MRAPSCRWVPAGRGLSSTFLHLTHVRPCARCRISQPVLPDLRSGVASRHRCDRAYNHATDLCKCVMGHVLHPSNTPPSISTLPRCRQLGKRQPCSSRKPQPPTMQHE
ncbi:hypothetical protein IQ06DRAFT_47126 [Phaeosphaeriaceae sp. SRC1lsM3a]|nr:hypothetical protein IQ06DRAFT_47126 [Stagonospora sp. SRC1lsM3a]